MRLYRSSGAPVDSKHKELYFKDLNEAYDALEKELGKCTPENAKTFSTRMEAIHRDLTRNYPNESTLTYPTSQKAMEKLLKKHGTLAFCMEDEKVSCYIMDS